jgi:DNA-binding transcriptional MocR family regulator
MTIPNLETVFDMEKPLYRAVADVVAAAVADGHLAPGSRLPAHRELAEHLGVTTGTVTRAYTELERRGLAKGEVGRGTFVRAGDRAAARFDFAADRRPGVVDLAYNLPPVGFPEEERLFSEGLAALAARGDLLRFMHYQPTQTLPAHRAAGRRWLERCGVAAAEDEIVVTAGSQHAILVALAALTEPGDEVLTECLTYPGVKSVAELLRLRLRGLPMDVEGVLPEALDSACAGGAKVAYLVPTIQNPTTATMSGDRRRAIVEVARRHSLSLVEDDIHGLLVAREERLEPLARLAPERTYYIANTSKLLAPALRVSYLRMPRHAVPRVAMAVQASLWMTPPLGAELATHWITSGAVDTLLAARHREATLRQAVAARELADLEVRAHPSGYHLWLELPRAWRADALTARLLERGVAVTPAEAFSVAPSPAPQAVRIGLGGAASRSVLAEALTTLRTTLEENPETPTAVL